MALPLNIDQYTAVIAASGSLSAAVAIGADTLVGIQMPAVWTAAGLTFQVSPDGGATWCELYDDAGNEVTVITPPAGAFIAFVTHPSNAWRGINMLKVRSGTAAVPVVQTPGATITLIGRPDIY
jgi:hypothetical protein